MSVHCYKSFASFGLLWFDCCTRIEIGAFLKNGKFSPTEKTELEIELISLHGFYMQFTDHGVILPVQDKFLIFSFKKVGKIWFVYLFKL